MINTKKNDRVIFIIPYAGGSFYSMRGLEEKLKNIDCITLELPGRGERIDEPLSNKLNFVVNDLFEKVIKVIERYDEYYFFGHSFGSLLSYLLVQKIMTSDWDMPKHLFVSGTGGPSKEKKHENIHLLSKNDFRREVKDMGGTTSEVTKSEELMSFFEPIIRSDFELVSQYNYISDRKINIPITAFFGSIDKIELADKKLWQKETNLELDIIEFEGDHFYIFNHWDNLAKTIMDKIDLGLFEKRDSK
ncbi:MAG: hypothetical protein CMH44_14445 [Muricauda sp.]|nr:hypothetical protein [Allomuricauda sp.]